MRTQSWQQNMGQGGITVSDPLASSRVGHPLYFHFWADIGPRCTQKFADARVFSTKQMAVESAACSHYLSWFEPYPADENLVWDRLTDPNG